MNYTENFYGIRYKAERGDILEIRASRADFSLNCWGGVLNLMSNDCIGRTALFVSDCDFFQGTNDWIIKVYPGTASYMKELVSIRPMSRHEVQLHKLGLLW